MPLSTLEKKTLAKKAFKIIKDPERWIQGSYARTKNNESVSPTDSRACKFCSAGVLSHVATHPLDLDLLDSLAAFLVKNTNHRLVTFMNDNNDHESVLRYWKQWIDTL